jgi:hypothetical protein
MLISMSQSRPPEAADGSWYGIDVGTRWRDVTGATTVVVLWVQRSGVIVYRREDADADDERVTNVVRFVETFAPTEAGDDENGDASVELSPLAAVGRA